MGAGSSKDKKKDKKPKRKPTAANRNATFKRTGKDMGVRSTVGKKSEHVYKWKKDSKGNRTEKVLKANRTYKSYDVSGTPQEALPDFDRANQGKHSYTLTFNGATVEVLLQKQAYFIKKCASDAPGPTGQVTWSKCVEDCERTVGVQAFC